MKSGFDVCLHNKRLDLFMGAGSATQPDKVESEVPQPKSSVRNTLNTCNRFYKPSTNHILQNWVTYLMYLTIICHVGLTVWYIPNHGLGTIIRDIALLTGPCVIIHDIHVIYRLHFLLFHLAAVYAFVFQPLEPSLLSVSFYFAALLIILTRILFKKSTPDTQSKSMSNAGSSIAMIHFLIDLLSVFGIFFLIILKYSKAEWELKLDVSLLTTFTIIYVSKQLPL